MTRDQTAVGLGLCLVLALSCFWCSPSAASGPQPARKKSNVVWIVFFSSHDCPRCESVKLLLEHLKSAHAVRTRVFDVERDRDYALFRKLESIHCEGQFAVPLIMVGESILQGEDQISAELEKTVKKLSRSGGAPLPYLGQRNKNKDVTPARPTQNCPCQDRGRPPTLKEEMGKIKVLFDGFFSGPLQAAE